MPLVSLDNVTVSLAQDDILAHVTCAANLGDRIGLVGRNGAGKTTLLHVLMGTTPPTSGRRHLATSTRVALVEQTAPTAEGDITARQEALSGISRVLHLENELERVGARMADASLPSADQHYDDLLDQLEAEGGFDYESRIAQIFAGLGLEESEWDKPLQALSGGQRNRVVLAKALLSQPDLLIMDEPTNHLDLRGRQWLEGFLKNWRGTVVVTSHDRHFLDGVATQIWHLRQGRLKTYTGNYSKYEELQEAENQQQRKQHAAQQLVIKKEEAFIRRFGAGTRASQAKSRANKLARLERLEAPEREGAAAKLRLSGGRSAELVLSTTGLHVGYGESTIVRAGNLELTRQARVALIGSNGSGKTTLMKTLSGHLKPVEGALQLGSGVSQAHYWQEAENLNGDATVLAELMRDSEIGYQEARDLLGRLLFSGDDARKQVSVLSGGERSRLALAKLVASKANLLLLDEPTNHLDIPSLQALEDALDSYSGTMIVASHDRRLIERLATELWIVEGNELTPFPGTLEEFDRASTESRVESSPERAGVKRSGRESDSDRQARVLRSQRRRRLEELEQLITAQEERVAQLGHEINLASERQDVAALADLGTKYEEARSTLDELTDEWVHLGELLADTGG